MLFNSFIFVLLTLVTFGLYYVPKFSKHQVSLLIVSSLVFYGYNSPKLVLLLLTSVGIDILTSYGIVYGPRKWQRPIAIFGVVVNVASLLFFKYSPLISNTFFEPNTSIGYFLLSIPLPVGISFFTFQGISLVVDVYKGKHEHAKKLVPVSLVEHAKRIVFFESFFPQLVAGPIIKAHDFLPQIGLKLFKNINWIVAFKSLVLGYFLKMVVADNLKDYTYWITYQPYVQSHSTLDLVMLTIGFSVQIFADFAGYSLIAIGLAELFGYTLMVNFHFPYIATTFKEFWQRWHISLSSFMMEYLYIPLGGNRKGELRTYLNLMFIMIVAGLWHGAGWNYGIWGAAHGVLLSFERITLPYIQVKPNFWWTTFKRILVYGTASFLLLLFKFPQIPQAVEYMTAIFNNTNLDIDWRTFLLVTIYSVPVFLYHLIYLLKDHRYFLVLNRFEYLVYGILLFLIVTSSGIATSFIYFQF